jgi:hypothetical protein
MSITQSRRSPHQLYIFKERDEFHENGSQFYLEKTKNSFERFLIFQNKAFGRTWKSFVVIESDQKQIQVSKGDDGVEMIIEREVLLSDQMKMVKKNLFKIKSS